MTTDDIDLKSFCSTDHGDLRAPFLVDDHVVASDGRIAVIVPIGKHAIREHPAPFITDAVRRWLAVPMSHGVRRQTLAQQLRRRSRPVAIMGRRVYPVHLKRVLAVMTGPRIFFGLRDLHLCIRSGDALGVVLAEHYAADRETSKSDLRLTRVTASKANNR